MPILELLKEKEIISFTVKDYNTTLEVKEEFAGQYSTDLDKEQVAALIVELVQLWATMKPTPPQPHY